MCKTKFVAKHEMHPSRIQGGKSFTVPIRRLALATMGSDSVFEFDDSYSHQLFFGTPAHGFARPGSCGMGNSRTVVGGGYPGPVNPVHKPSEAQPSCKFKENS